MPCQFFCVEERKKLIHTVGVLTHGKLTITNNANNYTGIFATGSDNAIIRLSLAKETTVEGGVVAYVPALVIKYLRDTVPSANSFAMCTLLGQTSWNFFKHDLSNHVPRFGDWATLVAQLVLEKFMDASPWPSMIGLSDMARFDQTGKEYPAPKFPYRLVFHPTSYWHKLYNDSNPGMPFNEQLLKTLTPGPLYDVYAQDQPPFTSNSQLVKIGTLTMTSPPSLSHYGDRSLFMQHTAFEDDLSIFPSWEAGAQKDINTQVNTPEPGYMFPDLPWQ